MTQHFAEARIGLQQKQDTVRGRKIRLLTDMLIELVRQGLVNAEAEGSFCDTDYIIDIVPEFVTENFNELERILNNE